MIIVNGTDFINITLSKEEIFAIIEDLQRAIWCSEDCGNEAEAITRKLHAQFELLQEHR
ncbi:hypothetical protein [Solibacillus sp. CAU 1738]|uniref:hypothetical protein n=1 Tax=Solibacillus sp. CAU 1738 TaxID=3140363 RepID=UPI0032610413